MNTVVRRIDHVFVPYEDPECAIAFFTQTLGLPTVWPYTSYAEFDSAGISLGTTILEFTLSRDDLPYFKAKTPARVQGIAFAPPPINDALVAELDAREIEHTPPMSYVGSGSRGEGLLWTLVGLLDLMDTADVTVFACEYMVAHGLTVKERVEALRACNGGVLGIERFAEVVVGTTDVERSEERWRRLFDPLLETARGYWHPAVGPAFRIVESEQDAVERIVFDVHCLDEACSALTKLGVTTQDTPDGVRFDAGPLNGLDVRLRSPRDAATLT